MANWLETQVHEVTATDDDNVDIFGAGVAILATAVTFGSLWAFAL